MTNFGISFTQQSFASSFAFTLCSGYGAYIGWFDNTGISRIDYYNSDVNPFKLYAIHASENERGTVWIAGTGSYIEAADYLILAKTA